MTINQMMRIMQHGMGIQHNKCRDRYPIVSSKIISIVLPLFCLDIIYVFWFMIYWIALLVGRWTNDRNEALPNRRITGEKTVLNWIWFNPDGHLHKTLIDILRDFRKLT